MIIFSSLTVSLMEKIARGSRYFDNLRFHSYFLILYTHHYILLRINFFTKGTRVFICLKPIIGTMFKYNKCLDTRLYHTWKCRQSKFRTTNWMHAQTDKHLSSFIIVASGFRGWFSAAAYIGKYIQRFPWCVRLMANSEVVAVFIVLMNEMHLFIVLPYWICGQMDCHLCQILDGISDCCPTKHYLLTAPFMTSSVEKNQETFSTNNPVQCPMEYHSLCDAFIYQTASSRYSTVNHTDADNILNSQNYYKTL